MIFLGGKEMDGNGKSVVSQLDFEQILENILDAVVILQEDKIIFANQAANELFSNDVQASLDGLSIALFIRPEDLTLLHENIRQNMYKDPDHPITSMSIIPENGNPKPVEIAVSTLYDDLQTPLVQLTLRDISSRKAAERSMMQSEKLSVIGKLSAGILHEVRNPLTSIKGFLQLLQKEPVLNKEYVNIIMGEVEQIERIANELLYFTRPNAERFVTQDLLTIAKETLFLFETQAAKKNVKLEVQTNGGPHQINGDKTQLKQVFVNLIKNAIEANSENGKVTVVLSRAGRQEQVFIKDRGHGIPKDILGKLGKSFFTTKESGTGLGLMITYTIIRNHNGKIQVESKENDGTCFTLTFPCAG